MRIISMAIVLLMASFCIHGRIEAGDKTAAITEAKLVNYSWYYDEDYFFPVGTTNSVATELTRLRALHPGKIFSNTPAIGLLEYEYGYFSPLVTTVIYSNL